MPSPDHPTTFNDWLQTGPMRSHRDVVIRKKQPGPLVERKRRGLNMAKRNETKIHILRYGILP